MEFLTYSMPVSGGKSKKYGVKHSSGWEGGSKMREMEKKIVE